MNIGVDMHVANGIFQGSRRYIENIYAALTDIDKVNRYYFFANNPRDLGNQWSQRGTVVGFGTHSKIKRLTYSASLMAMREKLKCFHFQYISPLWSPCPIILTVHDILFETHSDYFKKSFVLRSKFLVRRSSKKAAHIFTVSEYSKSKIGELYKIESDRITVTPNAINFKEFNPDGRSISVQSVEKAWGIKDYILTVGRLEPRKNHLTLIKAYKLLLETIKDPPCLVIVGQRDFRYDAIFREITDNKISNKIKILENVDDKWLPHLYRSALLFVFPSVAEGFGIPPLEAMACGRPVICSNTTALSEVVGDAALLVTPTDAEEISEKIRSVIEGPTLASALSKMSLRQAGNFSWHRSAETMLSVINNL